MQWFQPFLQQIEVNCTVWISYRLILRTQIELHTLILEQYKRGPSKHYMNMVNYTWKEMEMVAFYDVLYNSI